MMPIPLPATESSASRRPTVSARPMVNSRLGPGTWMKRMDATRNAIHWLVVGTGQVSTQRLPGAPGLRSAQRADVQADLGVDQDLLHRRQAVGLELRVDRDAALEQRQGDRAELVVAGRAPDEADLLAL